MVSIKLDGQNRLLHYSFPPTNDVFLLSGMNAVFMYITGYYSELSTKRAGHSKQASRFDKIPSYLLSINEQGGIFRLSDK